MRTFTLAFEPSWITIPVTLTVMVPVRFGGLFLTIGPLVVKSQALVSGGRFALPVKHTGPDGPTIQCPTLDKAGIRYGHAGDHGFRGDQRIRDGRLKKIRPAGMHHDGSVFSRRVSRRTYGRFPRLPVAGLFVLRRGGVIIATETGQVPGGEKSRSGSFCRHSRFESAYRRSKYFVKPAIKTPPVATGYTYTVQEIANAVKVSPAFIYREIKRGNLTAIRHNSRILRIPVEAFKEWQDACLTTANRCQLIAR